jgi:hypothetical protein
MSRVHEGACLGSGRPLSPHGGDPEPCGNQPEPAKVDGWRRLDRFGQREDRTTGCRGGVPVPGGDCGSLASARRRLNPRSTAVIIMYTK